jgi:hypothetical protein
MKVMSALDAIEYVMQNSGFPKAPLINGRLLKKRERLISIKLFSESKCKLQFSLRFPKGEFSVFSILGNNDLGISVHVYL